MTFFKIVKDGNIVNVGSTFLKWNVKRHRLYACNVDEGQFVQTYDEKNIYRASWLKQPPKEATEYETAEVIIINNTEYEDLKAELDEGQVIPEEVVVPEEYHMEIVEEEPEEKPLSIAKMRELIVEQQKQIDELMQYINSLKSE